MNLPDSRDLRVLRNLLPIRARYVVPQGVILEIEQSVQGRSLPRTCIRAIEDIRQKVAGMTDQRQAGLLELDLGLACMEVGRYQKAAGFFGDAREIWRPDWDKPLICLAIFAFGLAEHHTGWRREAAESYGNFNDLITKIESDKIRDPVTGQIGDWSSFLAELKKQVHAAIVMSFKLRDLLECLTIESTYFTSVDIIEEIRRFADCSLTEACIENIDECRRIVHRHSDRDQRGLRN